MEISHSTWVPFSSQRLCSLWSAPRIATSGQVQRHSGFEWLCRHNRLRPEPIRLVRLDSEHAQNDGKSANRGRPILELARGHDSWCWPKGARPLGRRMLESSLISLYFHYSCSWLDLSQQPTLEINVLVSVANWMQGIKCNNLQLLHFMSCKQSNNLSGHFLFLNLTPGKFKYS